ncbi:unnamed protein product [Acanthoscelides obtectus]|uniref:Uncharacterized protein n=1 Tax=Acanthoscelides obtectus TaxID=200917 RepID=A0A9P0LHT9_ACAOB|nr:unnamed protein product [Acanthoscelides obtectus]CAK1634065.1 hypothetical protein AOBTE_LOCUS8576 [Acanthoscelides obtectus]
MEKSGISEANSPSSLRDMIRAILQEELEARSGGYRSRTNSRSLSRKSRHSRSMSRTNSPHHFRRSRSRISRRRSRSRSRSSNSRSRSPSVSRRRRERREYLRQEKNSGSPSDKVQRQVDSAGRSPCEAEAQILTGPDLGTVPTEKNDMEDVLMLSEGECLPLSEDILNILGVDPKKANRSNFQLHGALASRWSHILANGLSTEDTTIIREKHIVPSNCASLHPPKINPEVKAILSSTHLTRDATHSGYQLNIGTGLTAMGKAFNVILEEETQIPKDIKEKILSNLTDSARILAALFHDISKTRKYLISPVLNKSVKELTENTLPGEFLFGPDLGERAKNLKSLEKAGQDLRLSSIPSRSSSQVTRSFSNPERRGGGGNSSKNVGALNRYRPSYRKREVRQHKGNSSKQFAPNRQQQSRKR